VLVDEEKCVGCRKCIKVCSFGAVDFDSERKTIIKCDHCPDRTANGENPACVSSCPTGALRMVFDEQDAEGNTGLVRIETRSSRE
jgi:carbon-monoxide dehydrogenase iron sulfur subunit